MIFIMSKHWKESKELGLVECSVVESWQVWGFLFYYTNQTKYSVLNSWLWCQTIKKLKGISTSTFHWLLRITLNPALKTLPTYPFALRAFYSEGGASRLPVVSCPTLDAPLTPLGATYIRSQPRLHSGSVGCSPAEISRTGPQPSEARDGPEQRPRGAEVGGPAFGGREERRGRVNPRLKQ